MTAEESLSAAVRGHLSRAGVMSEVKMFGGTGFMLNRNLVAAVSKRGMLLRVGKDRYREALAWPGARPMEMRGRTMEGYVYIDLLPAMLGRPPQDVFAMPGDPHPNALGHDLMANAIFAVLRGSGEPAKE